jgi:hypothetical protein
MTNSDVITTLEGMRAARRDLEQTIKAALMVFERQCPGLKIEQVEFFRSCEIGADHDQVNLVNVGVHLR